MWPLAVYLRCICLVCLVLDERGKCTLVSKPLRVEELKPFAPWHRVPFAQTIVAIVGIDVVISSSILIISEVNCETQLH